MKINTMLPASKLVPGSSTFNLFHKECYVTSVEKNDFGMRVIRFSIEGEACTHLSMIVVPENFLFDILNY